MIPDDKVREVAERTSIVEVVSDYVQLRKAGANYLGLCPFHGEKTASFNVNPAREAFHCFGCGAGGNVFSFLMKIEGVSFPEAVKFAARRNGIEIEERQLTPSEQQAQTERKTFQRINELAAAYYRQQFRSDKPDNPAWTYLQQRSVHQETEEIYGIGYASESRDGLVKELQKNKIDLNIALKLGIVKKNERGWYDQFHNRLMFQIRDGKGEIIAFAGRVLDGSLPKYINSPESPLYHKSSVLFGLDLALPSIRVEKSVLIVEGYFDHLALYQAGFKNVVATCGTALTSTHAALIKRHAERVYLLFDGDSAGQKAAVRSMELFMEQRLPAYIITLPSDDDPDTFLQKNSAEEFRKCIQTARPAFETYLRSLVEKQTPDSIDSKVRIIDELLPRFRKIADPIERDLYEKEICRLLGITVHAFRKRNGGISLVKKDLTFSPSTDDITKGDPAQETILALACIYPEAREKIVHAGIANILDGDYLKLASHILSYSDDAGDTPILWQGLCEKIEDPALQTIFSRILISEGVMTDIDWSIALENCLRSREKKNLSSMKEIAARLAVIKSDSPEYMELIQRADELRTRKSKI